MLGISERVYREIELKRQQRIKVAKVEAEAQKKLDHKDKMYESLVTDYKQSIKYRFDEQGNYIREVTTQKTEVEIVTAAKEKTQEELDDLKVKARKLDVIPRLEPKKIKKL